MKLSDFFGTQRVIAFTGLAKNAGKTTAMRKALLEQTGQGMICGITSSGRGGEPFDTLDRNIPKPQIFIPAGNFIATTDHLLAKASTTVRRIENTAYRTPLGRVVLAETLTGGNFEVAGPSTAQGAKFIAQKMLELGAQRVLIDGALNRQAVAAPQVCDGIVLSTGAVLNPNIDMVVEETKKRVGVYCLPGVEDPHIREIFSRVSTPALVDEYYRVTPVISPSTLNIGQAAAQNLKETTRWLLIPAAITDYLIEPLARAKRQGPLTIIAADPTKVFITLSKLDSYLASGIDLRVLHRLNLLCITANPVSPGAHRFDPVQFMDHLRLAIPSIPILDIVSEIVLPI